MEQVSSTPSANFNEAKPGGSYKITLRKIARAAVAELRVHKKIAIISYVLFGVSMLLFMFNAHCYFTYEGVGFTPSGWGAAFSIIGIIVGYFAALNVFRDVNNQQLCDVTMALPIKASERFWSKLMALFYLQTGPLIVAVLGGNGVALLFGRINNGPLAHEAFENLALIVFGMLSSSLFIMAIAVLCTCCCGAPAESAYFSIILTFVINALPITFVHHIIGNCSGFGNSYWFLGTDNAIDVKFWGFLPLFTEYNSGIGIGDYVFRNVISIVISLCVMFLSIFIYKKRDARTVGTPIASRVFFEVMMALGCFTIFSFFVMSSGAFWGVLIAGVAYIIINVIVSRAKINAMSFFKWIVKYAATAAVFTVLMVVTIKTGGFGQINSRPAAKYLAGAEFRINCYDFTKYSEGVTFHAKNLSEEQADRIMNICKKHIVKGRSEISAVDIMTESGHLYNSTTGVYISASSETRYRSRPTPGRHFERLWVYDKMTGIRRDYFTLGYSQLINISAAEARALIDELQKLDFVDESNFSHADR